jgi:UDP-N-acetylmuramoyl-tripeptide--D-alanyl-D-alanine ligase
VTLIDDAFNANPLSMKLALKTLRNAAAPGQRTVAVLGHMAELGTAAETYHQEIGTVAHTCADVVVGVGTLARHYDPKYWFESARACAEHLRNILRPRDVVLVKGSSSSQLYDVADRIRGIAGSLES